MTNGDGAETRASALFGVNSGDGRGNIMLGLELAERDAIHADDTDFWHDALRDGTTYPTQLIYTGPYFTTDAANAPSRAAVDQIFNRAGAIGVVGGQGAPGRVAGGGNYFWNEDGTVYTGGASFSNNTSPARPRRHGRRVPLQRPHVHVTNQRQRAGRLPVPLHQQRRRDRPAHPAVRSQHSARSQLDFRPRHLRRQRHDPSVRAGVERLVG